MRTGRRCVLESGRGTPFAHRSHALEHYALQVSNVIMNEDTRLILTKFVCNLKALFFAFMQADPPIEAEDYGIAKTGKTDKKATNCVRPAGVYWQYKTIQL